MKRSLVNTLFRRLAPAVALLVLLPFGASAAASNGGQTTEGGDTPTNISGIIGRAPGGQRTHQGTGGNSNGG